MDNNINKEKWIDEVLGSTHGMARAQPGASLYEKISAKLAAYEEVKVVRLPIREWVAAAILLVLLNTGSVIYLATVGNPSTHTAGEMSPLAAQMELNSTYNY